jgi:CTP:molybdopterin cytidylyltransferase MocA
MPGDNVVNAVVLAGRRNDGKLKDVATEPWEALIDIAGRPMVSWVLDAVLGSKEVNHVVMVAPKSEFSRFESDRVSIVEPGDSLVGNALIGCRAAPKGEFILLCTSDVPMISTHTVDSFLKLCADKAGADFYYPVVPKEVAEARFPGVHRTYASIKEGTFTGGNIMLVRASKVETAADRATEFVNNRKSPVKQAGLLGWSFVVKLLLHSLTVAELEKTLSHYFLMQARAIICPEPEIGVDVDKPSDLELARRVMQKS